MMPPPPPPPPPACTQLENGNMPPARERPRSLLVVCLSLINTITHILIGAVACVAFLLANTFSSDSIGQHIYLCVTGYVILMSQAIMSVSSNGWTSTLNYREKRIIHMSMQILGSTLAIAGSILRMANVNQHFQSAHGILGILAFIFTCISLIGGVLAFFTSINPKIVKICHACFGSFTITLAFLSLIYGFNYLLFSVNLNMMILFTVMALLGTLTQTCVNLFKRLQKK